MICLKSSSQTLRKSGTLDHLELLKQQDGRIEQNMDAVENNLQAFLSSDNSFKKLSTPVIVPVVVHVIWNTASQNISDAQVFSQIDVLNEDYFRLNPDTVNTPALFQSVAAGANIQFCLAQIDTNGLPFNGIHRVQTTVTSFTQNNNVKHTSTGGTDIWNPNQYLNMWICNLSGGILGYTQFPGGPPSTEGVVILYNVFGRIGNLLSPFDKGRTTTQEVGHYFYLYPIASFPCAGLNANDCNAQGDKVCDTPPATQSFGCPPPTQNSCTETNPFPPPYTMDMPDMTSNFMGYSDDSCMNLFTQGQAARMNATINSYYTWMFSTSLICQPNTINENNPETNIILFPTLLKDVLQIKSSAFIILNVVIIDEMNKEAMRFSNLNQKEVHLNLSSLKQGIYFVEITINNNSVFRKILKI